MLHMKKNEVIYVKKKMKRWYNITNLQKKTKIQQNLDFQQVINQCI